jgi:hypothetical protein
MSLFSNKTQHALKAKVLFLKGYSHVQCAFVIVIGKQKIQILISHVDSSRQDM